MIAVGAMTDMGHVRRLRHDSPADALAYVRPGEEANVRITLPVRLGSGTYRLMVEVKDRAGHERLARSDDLILKVGGRDGSSGLVDVRPEIELSDVRPAELEQA